MLAIGARVRWGNLRGTIVGLPRTDGCWTVKWDTKKCRQVVSASFLETVEGRDVMTIDLETDNRN